MKNYNEGFKVGDIISFDTRSSVVGKIIEIKQDRYIYEYEGALHELLFSDRRMVYKLANYVGEYSATVDPIVVRINLPTPLKLEDSIEIVSISEVRGVVSGKDKEGNRYYI